ncbi:MAG: hypothetical protein IJX90_11250 [Blautia sp.]|nr:hypothetical protein [Blautia sp.]
MEYLNFDTFYNADLATYCKECFQEKLDNDHVTRTYIRVLFTAAKHYDRFLQTYCHDDFRSYDDTRKAEYTSYLEEQSYSELQLPFTEKYIRFLTAVPAILFLRSNKG